MPPTTYRIMVQSRQDQIKGSHSDTGGYADNLTVNESTAEASTNSLFTDLNILRSIIKNILSGETTDRWYKETPISLDVLKYDMDTILSPSLCNGLSQWVSDGGDIIYIDPGFIVSDDTDPDDRELLKMDVEDVITYTVIPAYTGAAGLDTGTMSAWTWYYLWAIGRDSHHVTGTTTQSGTSEINDSNATFVDDGVAPGEVVLLLRGTAEKTQQVVSVDSQTKLTLTGGGSLASGLDYIVGPQTVPILSLSSTSPTMPSGYTKKRYIGAFKTKESGLLIGQRSFLIGSGIRKTIYSNYSIWNLSVLDGGAATTYTNVDCSDFVPLNTTSMILQCINFNPSWYGLQITAYGGSADDIYVPGGVGCGQYELPSIYTTTTTINRILRYKMEGVGGEGYISIRGYYESL